MGLFFDILVEQPSDGAAGSILWNPFSGFALSSHD